ncbi:hypothetical protein HMN09_01305400 [Mycena chlorophos]|uniref:XPG-I domain-containing protein n=1 Tax=Mycena chlorophos TaxID=658473 RepID=A0A8H6S182_MYCCL|nr:hypothetical protein HMN09_01305400 [Mycena chlorophos]
MTFGDVADTHEPLVVGSKYHGLATPIHHQHQTRRWLQQLDRRASALPSLAHESRRASCVCLCRRWPVIARESREIGSSFPFPTTMGFEDFWPIALEGSEIASLSQLNVDSVTGTGNPLRLGIDAMLWIVETQAVFHKPRHAQAGQNPELRALFYKVCALHNAGVAALRRGRAQQAERQAGQERCYQATLAGFAVSGVGRDIRVLVANGVWRAEAELAELNAMGKLDAMLCSDANGVAFGGIKIFRMLDKKNHDAVTVYTTEKLKQLGLSRGGTILFALVMGGNYADGLSGRFDDDDALAAFLVGWRQDLRAELRTNSRRFLKSRQPAASNKIPESFPNIRILRLYVAPAVSGVMAPHALSARVPDLSKLALFCANKFGWDGNTIVTKFKNLPHNQLQYLSALASNHLIRDPVPNLASFLKIVSSRPGWVRVKIIDSVLVSTVLSRLSSKPHIARSSRHTGCRRSWFGRIFRKWTASCCWTSVHPATSTAVVSSSSTSASVAVVPATAVGSAVAIAGPSINPRNLVSIKPLLSTMGSGAEGVRGDVIDLTDDDTASSKKTHMSMVDYIDLTNA